MTLGTGRPRYLAKFSSVDAYFSLGIRLVGNSEYGSLINMQWLADSTEYESELADTPHLRPFSRALTKSPLPILHSYIGGIGRVEEGHADGSNWLLFLCL